MDPPTTGNDDIVIMKFGISLEHTQMRGIGVAVFDRSLNKIETVVFGMGSTKFRYSEPNFALDWHEIKAAVIDAQMRGETASKLTKEVSSKLRMTMSEKDSDLNKSMNHRDADSAKSSLVEFFSNEMQDSSVRAAVSLSTMSRATFEAGGDIEEENANGDGPPGEEAREAETRYDCRLVLSPVKGLPVRRLAIGTKVMATIQENDSNREVLQELALERIEGQARVSGRVVSVDTLDPLNVKIGIIIAPGIFAFASTSAEVMVWAHTDERDSSGGAVSPAVSGEEKLAPRDFAAIVVSALVLIIMLIIVLFR